MAAAADDVKARHRDAPGEDAAVDERHDGVVVAGHHQGRLTKAVQPRHTAPALDRIQLLQVAVPRGWAGEPREVSRGRPAEPRATAVEGARDGGEVLGVVVAPGGAHLQEHRRRARHPADPGHRGSQDQRAYPIGSLVCQLLGDRSPQGHSQHVDLLFPECGEEMLNDPGDVRHPARYSPPARTTGPWGVECDRPHPERDELALEWAPHAEMTAESHDEQERWPLAARRDPDVQPVDPH